MPYIDPGDAFSSSMDAYAQQHMNNQIRLAQEARAAQHQQIEDQLARETLNEKRIMNQAALDEKEKASTEKEVSAMQPGDIPNGDLVMRARKHHIPLPLQSAEQKAVQPPVPAALAAEGEQNVEPTSLEAQPEAAPSMGAPQAIKAPEQGGGLGVGRYMGNPAYLEEQRKRAQAMTYINSLPADSPIRQAAEYELNTGKNLPAGVFKGATGSSGLARVSPNKKVVEFMGPDGTWQPVTDPATQLPKGTHFLNENQPKIVIPRNDEGATEKDLQASREKLFAEAAKQSQGDVDHLKKLRVADAMLKEGNRSADALLAPLVLGATISGMGSGFRMTQAEINKVEGATTIWGELQQKLQKYDLDPSSRSFTPQQLEFMKKLLVAAKTKAEQSLKTYNKARDAASNAKSFAEINAARNLMWQMTDPDANPDETSALMSQVPGSKQSQEEESIPEYTRVNGKLVLKGKK